MNSTLINVVFGKNTDPVLIERLVNRIEGLEMAITETQKSNRKLSSELRAQAADYVTLENSYHVLQGMLDEARDQRTLLEAALLVVADRVFTDELLAMNRSNMIDAIEFVRNRTGLGLKQSKEFVEGLWAANPL